MGHGRVGHVAHDARRQLRALRGDEAAARHRAGSAHRLRLQPRRSGCSRKHRVALDRVAAALLEHETLSREELVELFAASSPTRAPPTPSASCGRSAQTPRGRLAACQPRPIGRSSRSDLLLRPYRDGDFEGLYAISRATRSRAGCTTSATQRGGDARPARAQDRGAAFAAEGDWLSAAVDAARRRRARRRRRRCSGSASSTGAGEIGFIVQPRAPGQGYATEAARALCSTGRSRRWAATGVIGRTEARNTGSARVLEKLGMRLEAHLVENEWVKGEWQSELVYAMLASEWRGRLRSWRRRTSITSGSRSPISTRRSLVYERALRRARSSTARASRTRASRRRPLRVGESRIELLRPLGPDTPVGRFLAKRGPGHAPRRVRGRRSSAPSSTGCGPTAPS